MGLTLACWLGLYLVTRNSRYLIAWLTALTLWSIAGMFLNIVLAINPPPQVIASLPWLRFLFPFWSGKTVVSGSITWLQGWSVTPAVVFWHHVTILMLPGELTIWRWLRIMAGYFLAILAIAAQTFSPFVLMAESSNPLFLNTLRAASWYPFFAGALLVVTSATVYNLIYSIKAAQNSMIRKQLLIMAVATILAGLVGVLAIVGVALGLPIPIVLMAFLVSIPVIVIGIGVVRYSAFMQGRTSQKDFFLNMLFTGLLTVFYWVACRILVVAYQAPAAIMALIPMLAIITHTLTVPVIRMMDGLFYHGETRQLRSNLRTILRMAGEINGLEANLGRVLETLCGSLVASYGLIVLFDHGAPRVTATYNWNKDPVDLKADFLLTDDVTHLDPGQWQPPLEEAALLVPLYAENEQLGALILGQPVNGLRYADEDVESLLNSTDRMEEIISISRQKEENLAQIAQLAETQRLLSESHSTAIQVEWVEDALRNLFDYAYLADTQLAGLDLVDTRLSQGQITHLERGKVVHQVLLEAIEKLRPEATMPPHPPPREWYPYLILHQAYVEEVSNRDIMQRLYISEGTFNRTRRSAIRTLARVLGEMEAAIA